MPLEPPLEESPEEVRHALAPLRNGLSLAVFTSGNPFNVGAIIRVAHSFLVREIVLIGEDSYYQKASMGMHRFEHVERVADESAFFERMQGRPIWALEREVARSSLYAHRAFPADLVLAFGSERSGFPHGFLERCDDVLAIPIYGVNNSLPLPVAVGITLSYWASVRYAPGTIVTGPPRAR